MRKLLLALPLASLILLAGGCDGTCFTCSADGSPASAADAKLAAADIPAGATITEEQWEAMVAADAAKAGDEAETDVAVREDEAQPPIAAPGTTASATLPSIRTDTLPAGWSYMRETELSGGELNTIPIDQAYTRTAAARNEG